MLLDALKYNVKEYNFF